MFRVAIVDDEKNVLDFISQKVKDLSQKLNIRIEIELFDKGNHVVERHEENPFHVMMLDIEMPKPDGLEVAHILRSSDRDFILVFITNRSDLVFQSFEHDVTAFIRKDHLDDELEKVLDRVYQKLLLRLQGYILKTEHGLRNFQAESICYFASKGHNVILFDGNRTPFRILATMDHLEEQLSPNDFVRCHSGIIVNCRYIYSINNDQIELINHEMIPMSRRRSKTVKEAFQRYMRRL